MKRDISCIDAANSGPNNADFGPSMDNNVSDTLAGNSNQLISGSTSFSISPYSPPVNISLPPSSRVVHFSQVTPGMHSTNTVDSVLTISTPLPLMGSHSVQFGRLRNI